ncbi:MAG: DUF4157 domain-containing protein [Bacteroidia bacterium]
MNSLAPKTPVNKLRFPFGRSKYLVQPKLEINSPDDQYEQEADAMADRVMRMSSNEPSLKPVTGLIGSSVQRKCAECEEEEEKKKKPLMRKAEADNSGIQASRSLVSSLNASKGGGSPLSQGIKSFMENAFSTDFTAVRVHTDNRASDMSKEINAKAFTHGNDIYFGSSQFVSENSDGTKLLAHELTHVVQQSVKSNFTGKIQREEVNETAEYNEEIKEVNIILNKQIGDKNFNGYMYVEAKDGGQKDLEVNVRFDYAYPESFTKPQGKVIYSIINSAFPYANTWRNLYSVYDSNGKEVTQFSMSVLAPNKVNSNFSEAEVHSLASTQKKIHATINIQLNENKKELPYQLKKGTKDELEVEKPEWIIKLLRHIKNSTSEKQFDNDKALIYASKGMASSKSGTIWAFQVRTATGKENIDKFYFQLPVFLNQYNLDGEKYAEKLIRDINAMITNYINQQHKNEIEKEVKEEESKDGIVQTGFPLWAINLKKTILSKFDEIEAKESIELIDKPDLLTLRFIDHEIHLVVWAEADITDPNDQEIKEKKLATAIIPSALEESMVSDSFRIDLLVDMIRQITSGLRDVRKVTENMVEAYPGTLTPQNNGATVPLNSSILYTIELDKTSDMNLINNVTNQAQNVNFKWEVVRIDETRQKTEINKLAGIAADFRRRIRNLKTDKETLLGENRQNQSFIESSARNISTEFLTNVRFQLAMVGELTLFPLQTVRSLFDKPNVADTMEIPFDKEGLYMVRAIAVPETDKARVIYKPTVLSAIINVQNIETIAAQMMPDDEKESADLQKQLSSVEAQLSKMVKEGDTISKFAKRKISQLEIERDYIENRIAAGSGLVKQKNAEKTHLEKMKEYLVAIDNEENTKDNKATIESIQKQIDQLNFQIGTTSDRTILDFNNHPELMQAVMVDATSGSQQSLLFKVDYRESVNNKNYSVSIRDITNPGGRFFYGNNDSFEIAWNDALSELRFNLNKGRGWLSYKVPPGFVKYKTGLPNPVELKPSVGDQLSETVSDTLNVATLVAIMAAPFTAGASMSLLVPIGAIGAGVSAYRLINRAEYGDLKLDWDAASDFINIASLGAGKYAQYASKVRNIGMMVQSGKVAVKLFEYGGYVVMGMQTYDQLQMIDESNPAEARRQRITILANLLQGVGVIAAGKLHEHLSNISETTKTNKSITAEKGYSFKPSPDEYELLQKPLEQRGLERTQIFRNNSLEGTTVKVHYVEGELRIEIGPAATAEHIEAHVRTVEKLQQFQGFFGKLAKLRDMILNVLKVIPGYNTKGYEAILELEKLTPMQSRAFDKLVKLKAKLEAIQIEADGYNNRINEKGANIDELVRQLEEQLKRTTDELNSIEEQINEHKKNIGSFEEGRGFIAAEDRTVRGMTAEQRAIYAEERANLDARLNELRASDSPDVRQELEQMRSQRRARIESLNSRIANAQMRIRKNRLAANEKYRQLENAKLRGDRESFRRLTAEIENLGERIEASESSLAALEEESTSLRAQETAINKELRLERLRSDPNQRIRVCFSEDTLVWTPLGNIPISQLKAGDVVYSFDLTKKIKTENKILAIHKNHTLHFYNLKVNNTDIHVTGSHPFYLPFNNEWKAARDLNDTDQLLLINNQKIGIHSIVLTENISEYSYNLTINNASNYFVGPGILVHNINLGMGNGIIYRGTNPNPRFRGKVYIGQTTPPLTGSESRQYKHQYEGRVRLADRQSLTQAEIDFFEFKKDMVLEPIVEGISPEHLSFLEQRNLDIERQLVEEDNVMNRINVIEASKMPSLEHELCN